MHCKMQDAIQLRRGRSTIRKPRFTLKPRHIRGLAEILISAQHLVQLRPKMASPYVQVGAKSVLPFLIWQFALSFHIKIFGVQNDR